LPIVVKLGGEAEASAVKYASPHRNFCRPATCNVLTSDMNKGHRTDANTVYSSTVLLRYYCCCQNQLVNRRLRSELEFCLHDTQALSASQHKREGTLLGEGPGV